MYLILFLIVLTLTFPLSPQHCGRCVGGDSVYVCLVGVGGGWCICLWVGGWCETNEYEQCVLRFLLLVSRLW